MRQKRYPTFWIFILLSSPLDLDAPLEAAEGAVELRRQDVLGLLGLHLATLALTHF